ncbi:Chain length determinant protein [Micromonospora yangpuensis]|uniref:Chain length determinant protein n=1 Tax=Micromonospora yangpuensis TaxID=683228 RepID=A0A1C6UN93_9ACTN|nr:Chain length determinant protein [Micromonospora yangpuensis]
MEIVDYLRVARRRLWILLGLPLVAAAVAASVVLLGPDRYAGTSYVAAPALVGGNAAQQYTGTQAANQFAAAFAAAVTSPQVLDQVSTDTGVDAGILRAGLKVEQVGASSQLTLTYTATARDSVAPVLAATGQRALAFLFTSQVAIATDEVKAATDELTTATKAINEWEKTNKVSQPDKLYQATLQEIASLRQQRLQMEAVGNGRGAAAASEAITAGQKRLDGLGPKLPDYQALLAQRDTASGALANARQGLQQARAQSQAADPAQVVSAGQVQPVSRTRAVTGLVLPVSGAGLLLAVLLVAMLEQLSRNRSTAARAAVADGPAAGTPAAIGPAPATGRAVPYPRGTVTGPAADNRGTVTGPAADTRGTVTGPAGGARGAASGPVDEDTVVSPVVSTRRADDDTVIVPAVPARRSDQQRRR